MDYGKAYGMTLVGEWLPEINWFYNIQLIASLDEWNEIKVDYSENAVYRIDYPIGAGKAKRNAVSGTNGFADSIPGYIAKARAQGSDGVVLVAKSRYTPPLRYQYLGGFNIRFHLGDSVTLELVSRAFDGHELTQGTAWHERYTVAWSEVPLMSSRRDLVANGLGQIVTPELYTLQRAERQRFLIKELHYDPDRVAEYLPITFQPIKESVLRQLLDEVVLTLFDKRRQLLGAGLRVFAVQGNIVPVAGQTLIQPWEIFVPGRWE